MKLTKIITDRFISIGKHAMTIPSQKGYYQLDIRKLKETNNKKKNTVIKSILGCALVLMTMLGLQNQVQAASEPSAQINARMAVYKYKYVRNQYGEIMYTYDQVYTWVADDAYIVSYKDRVIDYQGANTIYERTYNYSSSQVYSSEPAE